MFINLSGDAPNLAARLGSFAEIHGPWNFADLVTSRHHRIDVNCNWKLFIQVFMEYYHLGVVHARTFTDTRYAPPDEEQLIKAISSACLVPMRALAQSCSPPPRRPLPRSNH